MSAGDFVVDLRDADVDVLTGWAHPIRRRILIALERRDRPTSPIELSKLLEESLGNVSYHVSVLVTKGLLELDGYRQVRGAIEHFYRLTPEARGDGRLAPFSRDELADYVDGLGLLAERVDAGVARRIRGLEDELDAELDERRRS